MSQKSRFLGVPNSLGRTCCPNNFCDSYFGCMPPLLNKAKCQVKYQGPPPLNAGKSRSTSGTLVEGVIRTPMPWHTAVMHEEGHGVEGCGATQQSKNHAWRGGCSPVHRRETTRQRMGMPTDSLPASPRSCVGLGWNHVGGKKRR